jgi:hypothetical protein
MRPISSIGAVSSAGSTACHCRTTEATLSSVTPLELRLLSAIAGQFPGFAERTLRGGAGDRTLRQLVTAQRSRS